MNWAVKVSLWRGGVEDGGHYFRCKDCEVLSSLHLHFKPREGCPPASRQVLGFRIRRRERTCAASSALGKGRPLPTGSWNKNIRSNITDVHPPRPSSCATVLGHVQGQGGCGSSCRARTCIKEATADSTPTGLGGNTKRLRNMREKHERL